MEKQKKQLHEGHRQRIKNKVKKFGLSALEKHEILEVLLSYSIPRKDVNPIAHNLLNEFGSISNVIDADIADLKLIDGVGEESALYFKVLAEFVNVYLESRRDDKDIVLQSVSESIKYFRTNFAVDRTETFVGVCLSKANKVVKTFIIKGKDDAEIEFTIEMLADNLKVQKVSKLLMFHTHPHGKVLPSKTDIETTKKIVEIASLFGVELFDHIILNSAEHYSFRGDGLLDEIKKHCNLKEEANIRNIFQSSKVNKK